MILWSTRTIKSAFKICLSNTCNQLQDPSPHVFSHLWSCRHPSLYFSEAHPKQASFLYHPSAFGHKIFYQWLAASEFHPSTSYRYRAISTKNNLLVLCDIVFDGFFKLFFCFHAVSTGYIQLLYFLQQRRLAHLFFVTLFSASKNPSSSSCNFAGFVHRCIYTLQHIPVNGSFYFVCRQVRSLGLLFHYNTYRMKHLDHVFKKITHLFYTS